MKNLIFAAKPLALDLISTLVFVALSALTHNVQLATALAMAAGVSRVAWLRLHDERINAMTWMSLGLTLVIGGATLLTHDPRFMMAKPSVIYALVGVAMLERGWMLPYMPPAGREHVGDHVMIAWGYVWAALILGTAALNAALALTLSFPAWSLFIAVFPAGSKIVLFAVQFAIIRAQAIRNARRRPDAAEARRLLAA